MGKKNKNKTKKKNIFLVLFLALAAILMLFVAIKIMNQGGKEYTSKEECDAIKQEASKINCYRDVAIKTNNVLLCDFEFLKDYASSDECVKAIASNTNNLQLCYQIPDSSILDDCLSAVSQNTMNKSICSLIKEQTKRILCKANEAIAKRDPYSCKTILSEKEEQDVCITALVDKARIKEWCNILNNETVKSMCFKWCGSVGCS
jgi:hypothetical protein